jgi:hypothetical protein
MRFSLGLLCLVAAIACKEIPAGPSVPLNQQFVLAPGQTATVEGESLGLRFVRVSGDSRCPADAICIQGGDAIVHIEVLPDGGAQREYDLHTGDMKPVRHENLTIELVQLAPYPFSSRTIQSDEYRATLRVTR